MIVIALLVTYISPKWSTSIFSEPRGPSVVRIAPETAVAALIFSCGTESPWICSVSSLTTFETPGRFVINEW
jgi:hypothetical protein